MLAHRLSLHQTIRSTERPSVNLNQKTHSFPRQATLPCQSTGVLRRSKVHSEFAPRTIVAASIATRFDCEESLRSQRKRKQSQREVLAKSLHKNEALLKKDKKPKGFSKGKSNDRKRQGPTMIDGAPSLSKSNLTIREMVMRTDRTNESSPVIKGKFKPLDNPSNVLNVLQGVLLIEEGVIGNNVTAGPLQHRCWRGCLTGTALDKFKEFTLVVGNETATNSVQVERRLVTFFAPREVLRRQQTGCVRFHMRKPKEVSARQHVNIALQLLKTSKRSRTRM
jgi:hypothetical protein